MHFEYGRRLNFTSSRTISHALRKPTNWNQHTDFSRFTRGRFVCDEAEQMAQRHIKFNMNELCRTCFRRGHGPRLSTLFDHTISPGYLGYDGPTVQGMERPISASSPKDASAEERSAAWTLFEKQALAVGYQAVLKNTTEPACDALLWQESDAYHVVGACRSLLENSEAYCLASIADLEDSPVQFSETETEATQRDLNDTQHSVYIMDVIKENMGDLFPEQGVVRSVRGSQINATQDQ